VRPDRKGRLLIAGVSVRALAASVARSRRARALFPAGFIALDYFGDADLLALASRNDGRVLALGRDLGLPRTVPALGRAALALEWLAIVYAGGLENRPALLCRLERRGRILGNGSAEVAGVRDPATLFGYLEAQGIPHAPTFPDRTRAPRSAARCYLWKPVRSGGGAGVRPAAPGERRPPAHFLQEFLDGPVGSAAFVGDGQRAALLGVTEQIVGAPELGGTGFRYGGNIAGPPRDLLPPGALAPLSRAGSALAARFCLRGLFGIDYVLSSGLPHLIEVNPRYTASMELFEEMTACNLFDLHLRAIEDRILPGPLASRRASPRFLAKGILYAQSPVRAGAPDALLALACRDVPVRGEEIGTGQPICTLVEPGESPAACRERLALTAEAARRVLASGAVGSERVLSGMVSRIPPARSRAAPRCGNGPV
jgi:predicted ATP-grasp superfamily ATP-dependent carboligase